MQQETCREAEAHDDVTTTIAASAITISTTGSLAVISKETLLLMITVPLAMWKRWKQAFLTL